ncbi:MAG: TetR/AcrR family transcriptional regulator [Paracoccaceae bacterium]
MDRERSAPRERLIETASTLFARHGYHAVGIARIVEEAGVSRVALYHHFRSKEELILAVLRRKDEVARNAIMREVEKRSSDPKERLIALFDFLARWFAQTEFTGCMFLNATAEYHELDDPIHRAASEHKRLMLDYLVRQCRNAGADDPQRLADQIYMLFDGAIVQTHAAGRTDARVDAARAAAKALIEVSCGAAERSGETARAAAH